MILADGVLKGLVRKRETFDTTAAVGLEASIGSAPLRHSTAETYATELLKLFPQMVTRAESLRILPASEKVPDFVNRYLGEASRCYIYGQFLASLFLCRSAIVEAVEDRLRQKGYGKDVDAIKGEWLKAVLKLAVDKGLLDDVIYRQADDIRILGNNAIHGTKLPTDQDCMDDQTRGILQHLYQ